MRLFRVLLLTAAAVAVQCFGVGESLAERPGLTNLAVFLGPPGRLLPPVGTTLELNPHWVGTVKRVHLRDLKGIHREDTPEDIRFTHLIVQPDERGDRLVIARLRYAPQALLTSTGRHAPALRETLPSVEELAQATRLVDLTRLCGPPPGSASVLGLGGTLHWTEEWTTFAPAGTGRLRYLNVLAHVSAPAAKDGNRHQPDRTNAVVDILVIREGFFFPADPDSAEERKRFLTAMNSSPRPRLSVPKNGPSIPRCCAV
jgi:hypothetical protein